MGRPRGPNKASDVITRAVVDGVALSMYDDAWLARCAGLDTSAISRARTGKVTSVRTLSRIVEATGLRLSIEDTHTVTRLPGWPWTAKRPGRSRGVPNSNQGDQPLPVI